LEAVRVTYLEYARRQRGWSQTDLGHQRLVGIHQTFISGMERGVHVGTPEQRERLARVLGVAPDLLLTQVPEVQLLPSLAEVPARG
jgi:ribosome-binding protein aMBF1 (putative translation factor)